MAKVTLYLMTIKGYEVLKSLISNNYHKSISEVIVGRDKNIENDYALEIIDLCKTHHISQYERADKYNINSIYSFAISWRWLINNTSSKLIVLHDSLLPKYRGFAPLVNMLINREENIGVSAIFATDDYDKGDIIFQEAIKIKYPITINEAINLISALYVKIAINLFKKICDNEVISGVKQNEELATYSLWRDENDYFIDWSRDAEYIYHFINAVSFPYKGAATYINGITKVRVNQSELFNDVAIENRDVGKIIFMADSFPIVVCGKGLLKICSLIEDNTGKNLLPLKNFRKRFTKSKNYDTF